MENIEDKDIDKFLKIFSNDDEKLQKVGQILSAPKSRKIYGLLINQQLNAKEIGKIIDKEENPRLPNLIFHLDKMVDVGLIEVEKRMQRKNGHVLKYYKAVPLILIVPPENLEKAKNSKTLKNVFRTVFKLGAVAIGCFYTYYFFSDFSTLSFVNDSLIPKIIISSIVGVSYLALYFFVRKKIKRNPKLNLAFH